MLPAHLESNFINPRVLRCAARRRACGCRLRRRDTAPGDHDFDGRDILAEIDSAGDNVGIVTLAPELDGALDLIRHLVSGGRRVSLGHSGATLEQSRAAIAAGARHATHLFNRMPPLSHREPGLVGAILTSDEVAAEIICDGVHVHRDMVRMAIGTKGTRRMMAITDGVAAAGLPNGSTALLGGRTIRVKSSAAYLDDGTLAGSVTTMDRVFRFLVNDVGLSLNDAARLSATTPAIGARAQRHRLHRQGRDRGSCRDGSRSQREANVRGRTARVHGAVGCANPSVKQEFKRSGDSRIESIHGPRSHVTDVCRARRPGCAQPAARPAIADYRTARQRRRVARIGATGA